MSALALKSLDLLSMTRNKINAYLPQSFQWEVSSIAGIMACIATERYSYAHIEYNDKIDRDGGYRQHWLHTGHQDY